MDMPARNTVGRLRWLLTILGIAWSSREQDVVVDDEAIVETRGSLKSQIRWSDVVRIEAWSADMAAYDQTFVRIHGVDGTAITIGELDRGFGSFSSRLDKHVSPVKAGWMGYLDKSGPGSTIQVYSSDKEY